jgi:hypothetical protein
VVVTAAVAVAITVVVMHESKRDRTITGCIRSFGTGMTIADENDRQVYELTGNTVGVTPGERMRLKGKKAESKTSDHTHVWVATKVTNDYGACQP